MYLTVDYKTLIYNLTCGTTYSYLASFKTASFVLFGFFGSNKISLIATYLQCRVKQYNVSHWLNGIHVEFFVLLSANTWT